MQKLIELQRDLIGIESFVQPNRVSNYVTPYHYHYSDPCRKQLKILLTNSDNILLSNIINHSLSVILSSSRLSFAAAIQNGCNKNTKTIELLILPFVVGSCLYERDVYRSFLARVINRGCSSW